MKIFKTKEELEKCPAIEAMLNYFYYGSYKDVIRDLKTKSNIDFVGVNITYEGEDIKCFLIVKLIR